MRNNGWIKLHRCLLDWEWYDDVNVFRLFIHLLLKANHSDKSYKGMTVKRGTLLTSRELLSFETSLSVRQIRTALNKLKSTNELTIETSKQGTVIQVVNYDKYQDATNELTEDASHERPTSDQRATTNKNVKNKKNDKEDNNTSAIPSFEEFRDHGIKKLEELGKDASKYEYALKAKYESWVEGGWTDGKGEKISRWKAKLSNTVPYLSETKTTDAKKSAPIGVYTEFESF